MTTPEQSAASGQAGRRALTELEAVPDVFETFFDASAVGLALADLSTRFVRVNAAYAALVDSTPEDLVGVPFSSRLHPGDGSDAHDRASLLLAGEASELRSERRYVRPDGSVRWVLHGVTVVAGADGRPAWFAVSAQDITERHAAEDELRQLTARLAEQAVRDPLTGLANRMLLEERLRAVLSRDARAGSSTGLLFLDLDGFKAVNDRHGHLVGDAVLRATAQRLSAVVRPSDTVARLGGDEFVVLVENADPAGLEQLADRLREAVRVPVQLGRLSLEVQTSVGTALSAAGREEPRTLLAAADRSMYAAKRAAQRTRRR